MKEKGVRKYILGGARLDNINDTKYEGIKKFKLGFGSDIKEGVIWKLILINLNVRFTIYYSE